MTRELFDDEPDPGRVEALGPQAAVLRGEAVDCDRALLSEVQAVIARSPLRHMQTPGGFTMSVASTSCGALGWTSDRRGYRYTALDPLNGQPWPGMPQPLLALAREAAGRAGFAGFEPDACLINRYVPGARLSLHQDRDEQDFAAPIVSVSLGLPAVFQFGGLTRAERPQRVALRHGDVVVWGGADRLRFHGVLPLKPGFHDLLGACRLNLTFRQAG